MTTRRWIVAVAIIAVMLGVRLVVQKRRERFQFLASTFARAELLAKVDLLDARGQGTHCVSIEELLAELDGLQKQYQGRERSTKTDQDAPANQVRERMTTTTEPSPVEESVRFASYERNVHYFQRMRDKYERAARHAWLPVEPDPPELEP
jgi:hypothetical protein